MTQRREGDSRFGLVLGGGGLVGMAYHAGVLQALHERGVDVTGADVIVGTSAGSIIGAYLASGWAQTDFYEYAHRRHPNAAKDPDDMEQQVREIFEPLWSTPQERVRRYIGSAFALASSRGHLHRLTKGKPPIQSLRKGFPSGMYSTERTRQRLHEELPPEWPHEGLRVCTVDLYSGERVVFGAKSAPEAHLADAVLASTAIPGVFPAVSIDGKRYVDGGAYSATSLDVAVKEGCDRILCVAPLGYRNEGAAIDPKVWLPIITRSLFARSLRREVNDARSKGVEVLVIRPSIEDLPHMGSNAMRSFDRKGLTERARRSALKALVDLEGHPVLETTRTTSR
ncbi:MAG: patatin-like phospholipase family protein [Actinomycetota bacterium]